jgi:hypothetical protein
MHECFLKFSSSHCNISIKFGPNAIQQFVDWFATILCIFRCASSWKLTAFSQFSEHKGLSTWYCTWKTPAMSTNHYVLRLLHVINAHLTTWILFGRCLLLYCTAIKRIRRKLGCSIPTVLEQKQLSISNLNRVLNCPKLAKCRNILPVRTPTAITECLFLTCLSSRLAMSNSPSYKAECFCCPKIKYRETPYAEFKFLDN